MTRAGEDNDYNDEVSSQMISEPSPVMLNDNYYMTYFLFYALGILTLVPANFFTTATDYWMYKFRYPINETYDSNNRTQLQAAFTANYSIVASASNILFLIMTIKFIKLVTIVKRIIGSLCGAIVMFAITIIFVVIDTDDWQYTFYIITLVLGFFLTGFCAVFMVTVFEMASKFPPGYIVGILTGQAICGIMAALVQIFSLSIGASSKINGLVYFVIGMFFIFITLIGFLVILNQSEFFKYHINKVMDSGKLDVSKETLLSVLNKIKYFMISMTIVLGCSIMTHPGVTSLVVSVNKGNGNKWNDIFFVPVVTFLFYHVFDYIGREAAGKIIKPKNGIIILILSLIRVGFVPMIMFCNAQPRHHLSVAFNNDWCYIIFILIFGITNGYLVNLCVIQVPIIITDDNQKKLAMGLILVFMIVSLGACSLISAAMVKAL